MAALVAVLAGGASSACSRGPGEIGPTPSTLRLRAEASTTTGPDLSNVTLPAVEGTTTSSTIAFGKGTVTLEGRVAGPSGPVEGATVQVERLVGDQTASTVVTTAAGGRYVLAGVEGGRLRIRAWRSPDLVQTSPTVLFGSGRTTVDIRLEAHTGLSLRWAIAPATPELGQAAQVVVQVVSKVVSATGVASVVPVAGRYVSLTASGALASPAEASGATDEQGEARWEVVCEDTGPSRLVVALAETPFAPAATTTTADPAASTLPSGLSTRPTPAPTTTVPVETFERDGPTCVPIPTTTLPPIVVVVPAPPATAVEATTTLVP